MSRNIKCDSYELKKKANWLRRQVLEIVAKTGKGHLGGTYSCADILTALYYGNILKFDPKNPQWRERDRFLIGKGHVCLALYNIWADLGILSKKRLLRYGEDGSSLGGQLNIDTPGSEYNTGSLGHVIGVGIGMALAAKMNNQKYKTVVLVGDGECAEGSIWESVMSAGYMKLNNLLLIVDRNRLGVTEFVDENSIVGNLKQKLKACGWTVKIINGHSFKNIISACKSLPQSKKPLAIIANTIKGKGVSFMENGVKWHHSIPTPEELKIARKELSVK